MKGIIILACITEIATGLTLIVQPTLVTKLLFGAEVAGAGIAASRVAGIGLFALGIACWPGSAALRGLLAYNVLATAFLAYLAIGGGWAGSALWPAVGLHAILSLLLGWFCFAAKREVKA
jgi:hypothetical protein